MRVMSKLVVGAGLVSASLALAAAALAADVVKMPNVIELSGPGAVSGGNWRDGLTLAIDEINAKGGILGRQIVTENMDTQSNAGVSRAQVRKALDGAPCVLTGPVFARSVKADKAQEPGTLMETGWDANGDID